ncbi:alpha/beta hydrolase [Clostridium aestuarii]|uniref:Alpha/beta hydrolase n=1 Tax=Clostridium aestuarii TaxID=338193 RepID=A0ABT4CV61_9CLOT|nr:alpha/beta hydrolase [Clostridium aestuarii]MCY6482856.1 alpha/beta hydrolase [Clostridium aestuarii]
MHIIITLLIISSLLLIFIGFYFSNLVINPKIRDYDSTYTKEIKTGKIIKENFEKLQNEILKIKSPYGYTLNAIFFPNNSSKKVIIFSHGITCNLNTSIKYMNIFLKRDFNILIYDHRNHGKSEGKYTTFGYYEKYDLKTCVDWILNRIGHDAIIGIHGESMGASTALQTCAIDDRVAFYIADCPFSDLTEILKFRLKEEYKFLCCPIIPIASLFSKIRTGMSFKDVSPIKSINNNNTPIFFIHGENDNYIPKEMSIDMYTIKTGPKKLYISPNADHAEAYLKNKKEYDKLVGEFLKEIGL